jgi:hypothetical protein
MPVRVSLKAIDRFAGRVANVARWLLRAEPDVKSWYLYGHRQGCGRDLLPHRRPDEVRSGTKSIPQGRGPALEKTFGQNHVRRTTHQDRYFGFTGSIH